MLQEFDQLPSGILDATSHELNALLGAPTLIHLPGAREPALFVSVLLHGNEPVGWDAVRALLSERLARYGEPRLPRALSLFIGNVSAAAAGVRHLPGQPDYNRVWPGTHLPHTPEHDLMARVVDIMARRGIFASLDLHNNTGLNPHYACINRIDHRFLNLASLFGRTLVYFIRPTGVQSLAMAELGPSVTVECGKVGEKQGVEHARRFIDAALHLARISPHPVAPQDIDLFHTVAQVKIRDEVAFAFAPDEAALQLSPSLEQLNFCELPAGMAFGRIAQGTDILLDVRDEQGRDVGSQFFHVQGQELRLRQSVMPSMLTRNEVVIRQDCLCYLMERYSAHLPPEGQG
ncbi:peptidase M14 [Thiocapsa imhoffii]|uniref:Peptidase M14 n=1 Tax=Thiocapsa imhoffii TaxID=382777 RepID=A0A9X0WEX0_9GAMM|nr:M14 family metallopeptidase [Thiocapsa imhoffii]MBK1643441.1 peptidase M14 [Thiocapsa imhoffii]